MWQDQPMIDLRSDTVTKPSEAMRAAMMAAPVGDDVYGDDPTVNALESRVAAMFGKEAALFTPSGSLANQLGIKLLVKPGEELITETNSHIVRAELGAGAVFSGITTRTWKAHLEFCEAKIHSKLQPPILAHIWFQLQLSLLRTLITLVVAAFNRFPKLLNCELPAKNLV